MLTPVTNSTCKQIPWLGSLSDEERQRLEAQGQRVVRLNKLQPWGKAVTLFAREKPGEVMAWLENGASEHALVAIHLSTIVMGSEGPIGIAMKLLLVHQNFPDNFATWDPHSAIEDMKSKRSEAASGTPIRE